MIDQSTSGVSQNQSGINISNTNMQNVTNSMVINSSSGGGSGGGVSGNSNVEGESRDGNMGIIEEEDSLDFSSSVRS